MTAGGAMMVLSLVPYYLVSQRMERQKDDARVLAARTGVVPAGERMQWDPAAGPPIPVTLPGDDVEDFVGRIRVVEQGAPEDDTDRSLLYVGAFDGATLERRWKVGPLGLYDKDTHAATHVGVSGGRVLVTDATPGWRAIDAATGEILAGGELPLPARRVCQGWIELTDDSWHRVAEGALETGEPPPTCLALLAPACAKVLGFRKSWRNARCQAAPALEGFHAIYQLENEDARLVLGAPSQGDPVPTLVSLAADGSPNWHQPVAGTRPDAMQGDLQDLVDIAHGRVVAQYRLDEGNTRLTALAADTGHRLWDVEVPQTERGSQAAAMTVTPTRIYLPHWTWLDIFDAASGAFLGTVGTY